jgi:hypothetical protein
VANVCQYTNNAASCTDGLLCTINDTCSGGGCVGSSVDCSNLDGDCTMGVCNTGTGQCEQFEINEGGPCSDGDLCTATDRCETGDCVGTPVDCTVLDEACNLGVCNATNGSCEPLPVNENGPCNDFLFCTVTDRCSAGACVGTGDPCTPLLCDEAADLCIPAPRIAALEVFYAGRFTDQPDSSRAFLAAGGIASAANISNYVNGITGIRIRFDKVVDFATVPAAAFQFDWTTGSGTTFSPVDNVATAVAVTSDVQGPATVVTIILADDHVRRRWLRVTLDSAQVTASGLALDAELSGSPALTPSGNGLPGGNAVFYFANVAGDVDGDRKTMLSDVGLVRAAVNPFANVPITNVFDVDKSGRVQLTDVGETRADVNPFFTLPLLSP